MGKKNVAEYILDKAKEQPTVHKIIRWASVPFLVMLSLTLLARFTNIFGTNETGNRPPVKEKPPATKQVSKRGTIIVNDEKYQLMKEIARKDSTQITKDSVKTSLGATGKSQTKRQTH